MSKLFNKRPPEDEDYWQQSFGDLVSLLLGFFVVMLSVMVPDASLYQEIAESMRGAMVEGRKHTGQSETDGQLLTNPYTDIAETMRAYVRARNLADQMSIKAQKRGVELTASGSMLFRSGSATLNPAAEQLLNAVAGLLQRYPLHVRIEGHTDDLPMHSALYPSNWELSTARAASVVRHLITQGVEAERFTAIGFAETRPLLELDPAGDLDLIRSTNRRVVLVMTKPDQASWRAANAAALSAEEVVGDAAETAATISTERNQP